jgi:two-component system, chemotaxis family, protein-glutamate methylesterase/glutaminase
MTMVSASEVYGANSVGVLLSGMGEDGAFGMSMIKKRGGTTIGQDEASSVVFGMAKAAYKLGAVDKLVPAKEIAKEIVKAVNNIVGQAQV